MEIVLGDRQSGKTTLCVNALRANPDASCFVPTLAMRQIYPKELQERVFSITSQAWRGKPYKKTILDEVDLMDDKAVWDVATVLDVILAVTTPNRWLTDAIRRYGFREMKTLI